SHSTPSNATAISLVTNLLPVVLNGLSGVCAAHLSWRANYSGCDAHAQAPSSRAPALRICRPYRAGHVVEPDLGRAPPEVPLRATRPWVDSRSGARRGY